MQASIVQRIIFLGGTVSKMGGGAIVQDTTAWGQLPGGEGQLSAGNYPGGNFPGLIIQGEIVLDPSKFDFYVKLNSKVWLLCCKVNLRVSKWFATYPANFISVINIHGNICLVLYFHHDSL